MCFMAILQDIATLFASKKQIHCALFVLEERGEYSFLSKTPSFCQVAIKKDFKKQEGGLDFIKNQFIL